MSNVYARHEKAPEKWLQGLSTMRPGNVETTMEAKAKGNKGRGKKITPVTGKEEG